MDYDFLLSFSPGIIDVVKRDEAFWREFNYELVRKQSMRHILALVTEGKGVLELGDTVAQLVPGTVFQCWPGNRLRITTDSRDTLSFYSVHFGYGHLRWVRDEDRWEGRVNGPLPVPVSVETHRDVRLLESFENVFDIWNKKNAGYEWRAKLEFLQLLERFAAILRSRSGKDGRDDETLNRTIAYMKQHMHETLSRERLARECSLSPGYFSAFFKLHTGRSPMQYLLKIRMDTARQLLRGTRLPIREVALQVGFVDSFYFARLFKKETGLAPSVYRQM
ncbi:helix-turn-helix domain-containing protein [Paenibacillus hodogayensis]|uniref:Helix-turn-helix domain-containing protein n=1 Tax=Paenibacillus hodogayensis TaxID=279208 RepID=A0ABV5W8T7_9BACL